MTSIHALTPYRRDQGALFHGRGDALAQLLGRIEQVSSGTTLLIVSGVSGVGKTSLLQAGLLPAVSAGRLALPGSAAWEQVTVTPGSQPIDTLAAGLAVGGGQDPVAVRAALREDPKGSGVMVQQIAAKRGGLILVIDQFEEAFFAGADTYLAALPAIAAAGALVLIGVRADFVDRFARQPEWIPLMQDNQFIVAPMTGTELRHAITGPASAAGASIAPELVDDILADLRSTSGFTAGTLPLLSQMMLRTWQNREGDVLSRHGYVEAGGVAGAIERSADELYEGLTADLRDLAQELLTSMVHVAEDGGLTRRRVKWQDSDDARATVLAIFVENRLVVRGQGTVEIAHDTLLTAWPRLGEWLRPVRERMILTQRVEADANRWIGADRDQSYLYRGTRLADAEFLIAGPDPRLPIAATGLLTESRRMRARSRLWRRLAAGAAAVLVVGALVGALLTVIANRSLTTERNGALARKLAAQSTTLLADDPALARLLAAASWKIEPTREGWASMSLAAEYPGLVKLAGDVPLAAEMTFSPDGATVLAVGDGELQMWNASTGHLAPWLRAKMPNVSAASFTADGRRLVVATDVGALKFLDVGTGKVLHTSHVPGIVTIEPSSYDGQIVVRSNEEDIYLIDASDGTVRRHIGRSRARLGFSGRAGLAAVWSHHGIQIQDLLGARLPVNLKVSAEGARFSPDGTRLVTYDERGADIWLTDGTHLARLPAKPFGVYGFSPDGRRIMLRVSSRTSTREAQIWDITGSRLVFKIGLSYQQTPAFSPDSRRVAVAGRTNRLRVWDVDTSSELLSVLAPYSYGFAFSPDGRRIATTTGGRPRIWDAATRIHAARPPGLDADRQGSARMTADASRVWYEAEGLADAATGMPVESGLGPGTLAPDGSRLAEVRDDGPHIVDIPGHRESLKLVGPTQDVGEIRFIDGGHRLLTIGNDGMLRTWDAISGRELAEAAVPGDAGEHFLSLLFNLWRPVVTPG